MRLLILIFFALTHSQVKAQITEAQIVNQVIIDSFENALSTYDLDQLDTYYTKDFLLLEDGVVWNLDTVRHYFEKALEREEIPKRVNTFDFIETKVSNDQAWVAYDNKAEFLVNNKIVRSVHWLESAVLIKDDDKWKIRMLHSTVIEDSTTPLIGIK